MFYTWQFLLTLCRQVFILIISIMYLTMSNWLPVSKFVNKFWSKFFRISLENKHIVSKYKSSTSQVYVTCIQKVKYDVFVLWYFVSEYCDLNSVFYDRMSVLYVSNTTLSLQYTTVSCCSMLLFISPVCYIGVSCSREFRGHPIFYNLKVKW